jgi:thiaminase
MSDRIAADLVRAAREEISAAPPPNRFLDLLEAGRVPRDRLTMLAGEEYHIVASDRRSFAFLASRFPDPPAGPVFLMLSGGEGEALRLLTDFAGALGWDERDLRGHLPHPFAQAYPAYLAWSALSGTRSGIALAMLANFGEWGGYCARAADALRARYELSEEAVAFFRFFAEPPPGFTEQATEMVAAGLAAGDDPGESLHAARLMHAYELAFWDTLAESLD